MLITNTKIIAKLFNTDCAGADFSGVSINSKDCHNKLFVAIQGKRFDGHDFIADAEKNGAKAIVSAKKIPTILPLIMVDDTIKAIGVIAKYHKETITKTSLLTTIALTGSNGKTTTKNMLKNILSLVAPTLATKGNLNNHIGVPLTLLELEKKHKYAIIEMGANHLKEIKYLRDLVDPDIAIVTNTLDAHIGEFGGKQNLIKAKGEIYHSNSKNIVNAKFLSGFIDNKVLTKTNKIMLFGRGSKIDYSYLKDIKLKLLGEHNQENALAAVAVATSLGIKKEIIKKGLENTNAEPGRMELITNNNYQIINDCYNASPSSTKYALKTLANMPTEKLNTKIAVLGDMAELGDKSYELHAKIGEYAKSLNIDHIYSIGSLAINYAVEHFTKAEDLIAKLQQYNKATILFKASRAAQLENIIKYL